MPLYSDDGRLNDNLIGRVAAQKLATKRGRELLKKNDVIDRESLREIVEAFAGRGRTPVDPGALGAEVRGRDRRVPRSATACRSRPASCATSATRSASSPRSRSASPARSSRCARSTPVVSPAPTSRTVCRAWSSCSRRASRRASREIAREAGKVAIEDDEKSRKVIILDAKGEEHAYTLPAPHARCCVDHGEKIEAGQQLNEGSLYPAELLEVRGRDETERYLVDEVQEVYKSQGVDINDKHIELIARQMLKRVRIDRKGDTDFLPGVARRPARAQAPQRRDQEGGRRDRDRRGGDPRDHEGLAGDGLVPVGGLVPGDHEGAHGRRARGQGRPPAGPEGERDHREADPGRDRAEALPHARDRADRAGRSGPTADEIGLLDEDQLAAELGLEAEGLEGLGAEISTASSATTSAPTSTSPRAATGARPPPPTDARTSLGDLSWHGGGRR